MTTNTMITFFVKESNTLTQNIYDSYLYGIQLHQLSCSCGHSGCLSLHGYYTRKVKTHEGSFWLKVCRVKCSECGRTHALLPSSIVPYSQISLSCCCQIITASCDGGNVNEVCEDNPEIDEYNVRSVIRRYRKHWKERLLSASISFKPVRDLVLSCFAHYSMQFMQIHRTPNRLFPKPT